MRRRSRIVVFTGAGLIIATAGFYLAAREADPQSGNAGPKPALFVASGEVYEGVPGPLSSADEDQHTATVCPVCTGADSNETHAHACQTRNLKQGHFYRGIEVGTNRWIQMACAEAHQSVQEGGGPFGAVIVQIDNDTNRVIRYWRCRNQVTKNLDPTAHAEVSAVRAVARELGVFNLGEIRRDDPRLNLPQPGEVSHCHIYSSCEPCPMCYAAIRWARINTIVFAATRFDAAEPGVEFSDLDLYDEIATPYAKRQDGRLRVYQSTTPNALDAFNLWKNTDKVPY